MAARVKRAVALALLAVAAVLFLSRDGAAAPCAGIVSGVLDALWTGEFPVEDPDAWTINQLRGAVQCLGSDWQPPEGER